MEGALRLLPYESEVRLVLRPQLQQAMQARCKRIVKVKSWDLFFLGMYPICSRIHKPAQVRDVSSRGSMRDSDLTRSRHRSCEHLSRASIFGLALFATENGKYVEETRQRISCEELGAEQGFFTVDTCIIVLV